MKYAQIGILACLVVISGLLFGIYRGQQAQRNDPAAAQPAESLALVEAGPEQTPSAIPEPATDVVAQTKPSPLPSQRSSRPTKPAARPRPAPAEPPAAPPVEAPPSGAPAALEPEQPAAPPPVIEPVIPNEPPLEMPESEPIPPQPRAVTVPQGAEIVVRMVNTISTNRNVSGDSFQATLEEPLQVDGWLVAGKGSRVEGRVLESRPAGRVKGVAELSFDLVRLTTADGQTVDISTAAVNQAADESRRDDLKKVGWGAGIGAIIGAIAGGGKGAAIGAGAGAGAGAGTVLATRGETLVVPTETRLSFRLSQPLEVTSTKPVGP